MTTGIDPTGARRSLPRGIRTAGAAAGEGLHVSVAAPFVFRYIMGMMLTDTTGTTWASAFNEMGEKMLGRSANDLAEMKKIGDETGCAQHTRASAWFRCAPACQLACLWPVTGGLCAPRVG